MRGEMPRAAGWSGPGKRRQRQMLDEQSLVVGLGGEIERTGQPLRLPLEPATVGGQQPLAPPERAVFESEQLAGRGRRQQTDRPGVVEIEMATENAADHHPAEVGNG